MIFLELLTIGISVVIIFFIMVLLIGFIIDVAIEKLEDKDK
jgi:hypothetical protein